MAIVGFGGDLGERAWQCWPLAGRLQSLELARCLVDAHRRGWLVDRRAQRVADPVHHVQVAVSPVVTGHTSVAPSGADLEDGVPTAVVRREEHSGARGVPLRSA